MKKSFCNCCSDEITKTNFFSYNSMTVEVADVKVFVKSEEAVPTDWDVCRYCVIDEINKTFDDRPKCVADATA